MAKKILIADDEEEIIELLTCALKNAGYEVASTTSGALLAKMIKKEKPDLLILDVLLPGLDGYSLQLQFSMDPETTSLPVIVISALPAARSLFEKFSQVKLFLSKPFEVSELINKLKELFPDK
jgi:CheY-like chemotaxis protein